MLRWYRVVQAGRGRCGRAAAQVRIACFAAVVLAIGRRTGAGRSAVVQARRTAGPCFQFVHRAGRVAAHETRCVLVAQVIRALHVSYMCSASCRRRHWPAAARDAALGGHGMRGGWKTPWTASATLRLAWDSCRAARKNRLRPPPTITASKVRFESSRFPFGELAGTSAAPRRLADGPHPARGAPASLLRTASARSLRPNVRFGSKRFPLSQTGWNVRRPGHGTFAWESSLRSRRMSTPTPGKAR